MMSKGTEPSTGCCKSRMDPDGSFASLPQYRSAWYFSKKELEMNSPSRADGIDWDEENKQRVSYCTFIKRLGMELRVPQLTIASAVMFCHRFFMRQSHAKNDWQTVAIACMFLAAKVEETPRPLGGMIRVAYRLVYAKDSITAQRVESKEFLAKKKQLIWIAERLLLSTIAYDLNVEQPYKPLMAAMKKYNLPREVMKVAWNFVNDWLQTTLFLQYKPHYIAAGALFIAAKLHNVQLICEKKSIWWQEFDVAPRVLEEAIKEMMDVLGYKRPSTTSVPTTKDVAVVALPVKETTAPKEMATSSPESCIESQDGSPDCTIPSLGNPIAARQQSSCGSDSCRDIPCISNAGIYGKAALIPSHLHSEFIHGVIVNECPLSESSQRIIVNTVGSQPSALKSVNLKRGWQEKEQCILTGRYNADEVPLESVLEPESGSGMQQVARPRKLQRV